MEASRDEKRLKQYIVETKFWNPDREMVSKKKRSARYTIGLPIYNATTTANNRQTGCVQTKIDYRRTGLPK
jgi:hypothetical protein